MDFKHEVFSIISELTGQNNIITLNVAFVDFAGDLEAGLFLSQVIYWSDRAKRADGFFYKTDDEWNDEIKLTKYGVRKSRKKLEELGILETKVKKANGNPTVHYKLDKKRFVDLFISFLRNRKNENANTEEGSCEKGISLTDTSTDIYTDKSSSSSKPVTVSTIMEFWDNNGFGFSNISAKQQFLAYLEDGFTEEALLKALVVAGEENKRTLNYLRGILLNWDKVGAKNIQAIEAHLAEFKVNKEQRTSQRKGVVPSGKAKAAQQSADDYQLPF